MITFGIRGMDEVIDLKSSESLIVIIEDPKLYRDTVQSVINYNEGLDKLFIEKDTKPIKVKDLLALSDIISLDINSKSILERILKVIEYSLIDSGTYIEISKAITKSIEIVEESKFNEDYELVYTTDPSDMKKFLKYLGINLKQADNIIDNLYYYISLISELNLCSVLVLANILNYLEKEEIKNFVEFCNFKSINLIILDNSSIDKVLGITKIYHIDKELFESIYQ